jgi:hypothetical protein
MGITTFMTLCEDEWVIPVRRSDGSAVFVATLFNL